MPCPSYPNYPHCRITVLRSSHGAWCHQLALVSVQAAEKRRLHGEKELHARMRVFARYMPQGDHDDLVDALILEQRLQHRIQARSGCKTLHADADREGCKSHATVGLI